MKTGPLKSENFLKENSHFVQYSFPFKAQIGFSADLHR